MIESKDIAKSFQEYFNALWNVSSGKLISLTEIIGVLTPKEASALEKTVRELRKRSRK